MENKLARILSYILHPIFIPLYVYTWLNTGSAGVHQKEAVLGGWHSFVIVMLFTAFIPALLLLILKRFKVIESLETILPRNRILPLALVFVWYTACYFIFNALRFSNVFLFFHLLAIFALSMNMVLNLLYPVSLHTMSWGALTAGMALLSQKMGFNTPVVISVCLILSGITAYARLKANAHNPSQVYWGWIAGVVMVFALFIFR